MRSCEMADTCRAISTSPSMRSLLSSGPNRPASMTCTRNFRKTRMEFGIQSTLANSPDTKTGKCHTVPCDRHPGMNDALRGRRLTGVFSLTGAYRFFTPPLRVKPKPARKRSGTSSFLCGRLPKTPISSSKSVSCDVLSAGGRTLD